MGIKVHRFKLYAYMAGSVYGAITGSFYGAAFIAIAPPSFGFNESLLVVMAVAMGGIGSIWGALLGAGVVIASPEIFRQFASARLLVFGLLAGADHGAAAPGHMARDRSRSANGGRARSPVPFAVSPAPPRLAPERGPRDGNVGDGRPLVAFRWPRRPLGRHPPDTGFLPLRRDRPQWRRQDLVFQLPHRFLPSQRRVGPLRRGRHHPAGRPPGGRPRHPADLSERASVPTPVGP